MPGLGSDKSNNQKRRDDDVKKNGIKIFCRIVTPGLIQPLNTYMNMEFDLVLPL